MHTKYLYLLFFEVMVYLSQPFASWAHDTITVVFHLAKQNRTILVTMYLLDV